MICYHGSQPQEGSHNNQPSEKAEASESKLDRYSFYYIGCNQDFEAEQQRSTDAYFILIVMPLHISLMVRWLTLVRRYFTSVLFFWSAY
jgi:hypothetical protein